MGPESPPRAGIRAPYVGSQDDPRERHRANEQDARVIHEPADGQVPNVHVRGLHEEHAEQHPHAGLRDAVRHHQGQGRGGATPYAAQVHLQSLGRSDREEFLKRRVGLGGLAAAAVSRGAFPPYPAHGGGPGDLRAEDGPAVCYVGLRGCRAGYFTEPRAGLGEHDLRRHAWHQRVRARRWHL